MFVFIYKWLKKSGVLCRIANQPLLDSRLGRKYGILLLLFFLAAASVAAMFWTTDIGRTILNIFGRAMSGGQCDQKRLFLCMCCQFLVTKPIICQDRLGTSTLMHGTPQSSREKRWDCYI
jgi:hypothetical protein